MIYLYAALKSVFSVVVLFLLTKMMGRRQVSQLSLFDYVNGISFGSIAAEIAISRNIEDVFIGTVAMAVYTGVALLFDVISNHSIKARRFIEGVPIILVEHGKIYEKNFSRAKIDLNEFLMSIRKEGFFDLDEVDTAIFEPNGMISVLPKADREPVRACDLNINREERSLCAVAIIDGKIMENNVKNVGFDVKYVENKLKSAKISADDVFYASLSSNGKLSVYSKTKTKPNDILE